MKKNFSCLDFPNYDDPYQPPEQQVKAETKTPKKRLGDRRMAFVLFAVLVIAILIALCWPAVYT